MTLRTYSLTFRTGYDEHARLESKLVEALDAKDAIEIAQRKFGPLWVFVDASTMSEREA